MRSACSSGRSWRGFCIRKCAWSAVHNQVGFHLTRSREEFRALITPATRHQDSPECEVSAPDLEIVTAFILPGQLNRFSQVALGLLVRTSP